ncbi:MAG: transglycosylase domain-containing protein, partial [Alicyclobacillus sp.]|nr:transglycosylase domain-containing protein [Alicyclobacillus sp.]
MQPQRSRRWTAKRVAKFSGFSMVGFVILATGAGVGYIAALLKGLPAISASTFTHLSQASVVYDVEGRVIGEFAKDGDRQPITSIRQVSPHLVHAFIAAEDKTFYHNIGINPPSILRAAMQNLLAHRIESGFSTITQQTVKLALFPEQQRTLKRKVQEVALALELNRLLSKDEILTDYMNWVYMGKLGSQNVYGVKKAAEILFHKDPKDLNLPEAAFLAAIPNNPSWYNPYQNADRTRLRQR